MMGKWNNWATQKNLLKTETPKNTPDTFDTVENLPSFEGGWEKVFPANDALVKTIYWRKGDIRIPVEQQELLTNVDISGDNEALQAVLTVVIEEALKNRPPFKVV